VVIKGKGEASRGQEKRALINITPGGREKRKYHAGWGGCGWGGTAALKLEGKKA